MRKSNKEMFWLLVLWLAASAFIWLVVYQVHKMSG